MKNLSHWAKINPKKTWGLITILYILLHIPLIFLSSVLYDSGITFPGWIMILTSSIGFLLIFLYPTKKSKWNPVKYSYFRQKAFDFTLVMIGGAIFTFWLTNRLSTTAEADMAFVKAENQFTNTFVKVAEKGENLEKSKSKISRKSIREYRKKLRNEIRELRKVYKDEMNDGDRVGLKILLIALTLVGAFLIGYLLAILACYLACSGVEAAAVAVIILGGLGLVFLTVVTIRHIVTTV